MDAYRQLPAMNQGGNSYTAATRLPPDAVEEISVETSSAADAEAGAGTINVILKSGSTDQVRDAARKAGMRTLADDGWRLVQGGITTVEEVLSVTTTKEVARTTASGN